MSNKDCKEELNLLYGKRCMLTNLKSERLTFHHILKKQCGGKATVENGANLHKDIHAWLHSLEQSDRELFNLINDCLGDYKMCLDHDKKELVEEWETECATQFVKKIRRSKI